MPQVTNDPLTEPQSPPSTPHTLPYGALQPNPKRTATTVLGIIAIVIGAIGLLALASFFNAVGAIVSATTTTPSFRNVFQGLLYADAVLQLTCKLGLLSTGILMLLRKPSARLVAVLTLIISPISSGIAILLVRHMRVSNLIETNAALRGTVLTIGFTIGTVALCSSLIIYMMTKATRKEFATVSATSTPPTTSLAYDNQPPPVE